MNHKHIRRTSRPTQPKGQTMKILAMLAFLCVFLVAVIGWVRNIFILIGMASAEISAEFVLRLVGIPFAPLGAVMGYI